MKWRWMSLLVVLAVSTAATADILYTTYADNNTGALHRYDDEMNLIWQSTNQRSIHRIVVSPLNGNIYAGFDGTDKMVKQFDINTGALIGTTVPTIGGLGSNHVNGLTFGHDWNGDGVPDLWIVTRDSMLVFNGVGTIGSGATTELARWTVADQSSSFYDGTGGSDLVVGPDITGDGISELYVGKGQNNNSYGRINVYDIASSGVGNENLVRVASYAAGSTKDHEAILLGPDYNNDGQLDLLTVSSRTYVLRSYDFVTGTDLGALDEGLTSRYFPLTAAVMPNGSLLVGTRMKTELDPGWVNGAETGGGNLVRLDRVVGQSLAYTPTLLALPPQAGEYRFCDVLYYDAKTASAPVPVPGKKVSLDLDQISWINPDPNEAGGTITCDVWFSTSYPEYLPYADPNILKITDPNDRDTWSLENRNFESYAVKAVDNQPVSSVDLSTITAVPLVYGQTYYWRVDTRDSSDVQSGTTVGPVWLFTADNSAPQVDAGQTIYAYLTDGTVTVQTDATVTDDGRPNPPAAVSLLWELQAGEAASVTINSPTVEDTTITVTATGTYVFVLTADDGELTNLDVVTVNVYEDACAAAKAVPGYTRSAGDINDDCDVDFEDLQIMAGDWLQSTALP